MSQIEEIVAQTSPARPFYPHPTGPAVAIGPTACPTACPTALEEAAVTIAAETATGDDWPASVTVIAKRYEQSVLFSTSLFWKCVGKGVGEEGKGTKSLFY